MKISIPLGRILLVTGLLTMIAVPSVTAESKSSYDMKDDEKSHDDDDHDYDNDHDNACGDTPGIGWPPMLVPSSMSNDKDDKHDEEECEEYPDIPDLTGLSPTIFALPATR